MLDVKQIRKDFPILDRKIVDKPLVYLDNASTSQKPIQVLEAMDNFYKNSNANVHRGIHTLSVEATKMLEEARAKVAKFVGVEDPSEIIFVRNATEAINLVAKTFGENTIKKGDEVVLTEMEHHSNIVPWQVVCRQKGARLKFLPITKTGKLVLDDGLEKFIGAKTKILALTHVSNVLGTINPLAEIIRKAKKIKADIKVLVDGAQAVPHLPVNINKLGCDFYVFTGHKMLGPTGIGVLWAKRELLETMPPFLTGGEMVSEVSFEKASWNDLPWKFEAGTPNIAGAIGLAAAIDCLLVLGMDKVRKHEEKITQYALNRLSEIDKISIFGPKNIQERGGVVAFNFSKVHAHDVASILDGEGIAVRSGHHCAQPLMSVLKVASTARASFYIYNDEKDVDLLVDGILKVAKIFKPKKFLIDRSIGVQTEVF